MNEFYPRATNLDGLPEMVTAYLTCAEWAGIFTLDAELEEVRWSRDAIQRATRDCAQFVTANRDDASELELEQLGHDLWLTRNGHGAGFWDRGLGEVGERLAAAARDMGEAIADADGATLHLL